MKNYLISLAWLALVGCSAVSSVLNDYTLIAGAVAYKATAELIELTDDRSARATRILRYTDAAMEVVDSSQEVTLDALYQTVYDMIDWDRIPRQDHVLVNDLLIAVRDRLAEEVDEVTTLTPETEVSLVHIINRIRSAAIYYV